MLPTYIKLKTMLINTIIEYIFAYAESYLSQPCNSDHFFFNPKMSSDLDTAFYWFTRELSLLDPYNRLPATLDADLTLMLGLNLSYLLFFIGLFGMLLNQKNIIIIFLCVELMLFGAGLQFLFYFLFFGYELGQIYALLILTIATAETAIGLGIIVLAYRLNRSVSFETFSLLRG
jgi:NADH-quinone oxidoreductase subunit K